MRGFVEKAIFVMAVTCLISVGFGLWFGAESQRARTSLRQISLLEAIEQVESGGDTRAVGRQDEVGVLQIRPIMVEEVNRILALQGKSDRFLLIDRFDREKSHQMFYIYGSHWADRTGDYSTEGWARRWSGGPDGHTQDATLPYWERVRMIVLRSTAD